MASACAESFPEQENCGAGKAPSKQFPVSLVASVP